MFPSAAFAENLANEQTSKSEIDQSHIQPLSLNARSQVLHDTYILGPGDRLEIDLLDLPELSGVFSIGPDGSIYLPRLRALYVEGLTVEELRNLLTKQFRKYGWTHRLTCVSIVSANSHLCGRRSTKAGYYTLRGVQIISSRPRCYKRSRSGPNRTLFPTELEEIRADTSLSRSLSASHFPTVFDAIRTAQGITPYSNLGSVQITRKRARMMGGGRIRTNINLLSLITEGDESQNIRLFDGDVVKVRKSNVVMREQLLKAGQTNLNPQFFTVFVTGRVNNPGGIQVPQGGSLNQAIALAGGARLLRGKVEFVRLTKKGELDKRIFRYKPAAVVGAVNNPLLSKGDLIRVKDSPLSASVSILNEITAPAIGIYSIYALFGD